MSLIECTLGAATQHVNGTTYDFSRDQHGRYVARVLNLLDRSLFLAVTHYREVPEVPEEPKPKRARAATTGEQQQGGTGEQQPQGGAGATGEQQQGGTGGQQPQGGAGGQQPQGGAGATGEQQGAPSTPESEHGEANATPPATKPKGRGGRKPKANPEA